MLLFVNTFIKRPVLTTVCSIIIVLAGLICIPLLPVSQLPQLANTEIQISSAYIGADAETTENTVTTILEREINGVEDMKYISSSSTNNGATSISVAFPNGVDRNIAQVNVQNRVAQGESALPDVVRQVGVSVEQASPSILLVIGFYSDKDAQGKPIYDPIFMSNYLDLSVVDQIQRVPGVGSVQLFGERKYAMRLWLNPQQLAARELTAQDVVAALREQNIQVGVGKIGQNPAPSTQLFEIPLQAVGRFQTPEEFNNLILKRENNGTLVTIQDVGRVELGAEDYSLFATLNGEPTVGLGIYQLPGSNSLEVGRLIKETLEDLKKSFPPGLNAIIAYDTTVFVQVSIEEVVKTLRDAILLVVLVLFVFLQDWRATLIPAMAIPVALVGAMIGLKAFGFELNTLTLFACTLASGLVVDDAIVIVEAISVKIEQGMKPRQAALDAMQELTSATIATSIVLMAVFIPVSFFPGTVGVIYKQFALTIVFALVFSTFNALSFSPSMSAVLLRQRPENRGPLGWFFDRFNDAFNLIQTQYGKLVTFLTRINAIIMMIFVGGLVATVLMYQIVPQGFVPEEDQGYFITVYQAPDGVSLNYTANAAQKVVDTTLQFEEVENVFAVAGFGFEGANPSQGVAFCLLKPWEDRPSPEQSVYGVLRRLNGALQSIPQLQAFALNAPPVPGLSNTGGVEMQLQDRTGSLPIENLLDNGNRLIGALNSGKYPAVGGAFSQFSANKAQKRIEVLRDRAKALNVDIADILNTLQINIGSSYVNDFVFGQRQYRVYVQAESDFRSAPEALNSLSVRSRDGDMIPLGNLIRVTDFVGPEVINHFNIFRSMLIQANPAPGASTGQLIAQMEAAARAILDPGYDIAWQGSALEEKSSGGSAPIIFGLGFVMVFLVLSAQYESYIDPLIIMLAVPLAVLGALAAVWFRSNVLMAGGIWPVVVNDVYCQVALVMLIGLASKNSILIVEFANQLRDKGLSITKAAIQAAEQRFRPILMTAVSSLIGFWPLVVASGAGSGSRWSLGTAVFGGMFVGTFLTLLITPNLFIAVKTLEDRFLNGGKGGKGTPNDQKGSPSNSRNGSNSMGKDGNTPPQAGNGPYEPSSSSSSSHPNREVSRFPGNNELNTEE